MPIFVSIYLYLLEKYEFIYKICKHTLKEVGSMKKAVIAAGLTSLALVLTGCRLQPVKPKLDKHTVMIYMCGADLESGYDGYSSDPNYAGLGSADIAEICYTYNMPDDVNIIIETGGAMAWKNYKIDETKLQRWHIEDRVLVKDEELSYQSMGQASTFQSFLEWGLTKYPAEKTGVVLWNHGGAMQGVCFDERKDGDGLLSSEVTEALKGAFKTTNRTEKLEWIGYDACLMQVQDIAEANSDYFNYMVGAQESEAGEGWDYDKWLPNLYNHESTETILKGICDSFVASYKHTPNDQTLSVLNLNKMSAYKNAWESLSSSISSTVRSTQKTSFQNMMKSVKTYGTTVYSSYDLYEAGLSTNPSSGNYFGNYGIVQQGSYYYDYGYNSFGTFDVLDFLNKLESNYSSLSSSINAVRAAYNDMLVHNVVGAEAGESNGLCLFFPMSERCGANKYYTAKETRLSSWRTVTSTLGKSE